MTKSAVWVIFHAKMLNTYRYTLQIYENTFVSYKKARNDNSSLIGTIKYDFLIKHVKICVEMSENILVITIL